MLIKLPIVKKNEKYEFVAVSEARRYYWKRSIGKIDNR